ncbi:MAG: hypothetical protein HC923_09355 [Myxococcales bacterium]|nr:hypothetical protein [Myxococcales bacterium]
MRSGESEWASRAGRLVGLEASELRRALPIVLAHAGILAAIYVLKPARNALFLDQVGVAKLPFVLVLVAVVGGLTALAYSRQSTRWRTDRLVQASLLLMASSLVGCRLLLGLDSEWVYFAFFVWVQLFGLLSTSLVWLWANAAFDAREARRVFGLIATGGIFGAILGGLFTGAFAGLLGARNLVVVAAALVAGVVFCLGFAPPPIASARKRALRGSRGRTRARAAVDFVGRERGVDRLRRGVRGHPLQRLRRPVLRGCRRQGGLLRLVLRVGQRLLAAVSDLGHALAPPADRRRRGSDGAADDPRLRLRPLLGVGGLPFAATPKAADGSFRHSIHKSATELLFLPIPERTKRRNKLFIDTTVDTTATGLGALVVLFFTEGLRWSYTILAWLTLAFALGGIFLARRLRAAYVDAFRRAIESRRIDLTKLTVGLDEASVRDLLRPVLRSDQPRQVLYALDLMAGASSRGFDDDVRSLLGHPAASIRRRALELLGTDPKSLTEPWRSTLLADEDPDVRALMMTAWARLDPDAVIERSLEDLESEDERAVVGALAGLLALPKSTREDLLDDERLDRLEARSRASDAIGASLAYHLASDASPRSLARISRILGSCSGEVAIAAIRGAAESRAPELLDWLVSCLSKRGLRTGARRALARYGAPVVGLLDAIIDDGTKPIAARKAAIRALADSESSEAQRSLLARLDHGAGGFDPEILEGLNRMRRRHGMAFPAVEVTNAMSHRARELRVIRATRKSLPPPSCDTTLLFDRALEEKSYRSQDEIFVLLGLIHDPKAIEDAQVHFRRGDRVTRAAALEYVVNVVDVVTAQWLLPALEAAPARGLDVDDVSGSLPSGPRELMDIWVRARDPWLRACALAAAPRIPASGGDPSTSAALAEASVREWLGEELR